MYEYIHRYIYMYVCIFDASVSFGNFQVPRHRATVGSYGGAVSYERGTLVRIARISKQAM